MAKQSTAQINLSQTLISQCGGYINLLYYFSKEKIDSIYTLFKSL